MASVAVLGIRVESQEVTKADAALDGFEQSAIDAEKAANRFSRANDNLEREARGATSALKAQTAAQKALRAASGAAAFRQRQLAVQSLDVAQSLAMGISPMQTAIQQGGQLAGIYAGQGGLTGAVKEASASILGFARANPIAVAATAALGIATLGLQADIKNTTGVTVGFGDVFVATMQEVAAVITSVAGPAISSLGALFATVSNGILNAVKLVGNSIINTFDFAIEMVKATWSGLPNALKDIAIQAMNGVADFINPALSALGMDPIQFGNPSEGGASSLAKAYKEAASVFENDRVGSFLTNVSERAVQLAAANDNMAESFRGVSRAAGDAGAPLDLVSKQVAAANDNVSGFAQTADSSLSGFLQNFNQQVQNGATGWEAFKAAGLDALNQILNKMIEMASSSLVSSLFGGGGFLGSLFGGSGGGFFGALYANGGVFNQQGVTAFANGGVVNGPTVFPFANGVGLMGEAGPEAIMPLKRAPNGRLGVEATGTSQPAVKNENLHVTVGVSADNNGNLLPFVQNVAQDTTAEGIRQNNAQIARQDRRAKGTGRAG